MANENPVYLKLEYSESVESKKNILSSEVSLINIIKIIKRYKSLREDEFVLRAQMYKLIKEANLAIRKTKNSFPFINLPEKHKIEEIKIVKAKKIKEEKADTSLEYQLRDIQEKLRQMGS
jgi:hypothetical protein